MKKFFLKITDNSSFKNQKSLENFSYNTQESIFTSLGDDSNRYLMLFFDSEITKTTLQYIFDQFLESHHHLTPGMEYAMSKLPQGETSFPSKKHYLLGSSLFFDENSKEYSIKILSKIKHFSNEPCLLILDNLDIIYGTLYDLFNQRFTANKENRYCNIVYEDFKESLSIDVNFRCIIFKNETDFDVQDKSIEKKLPSPLMNRFEKHLFSIQQLEMEGKMSGEPGVN